MRWVNADRRVNTLGHPLNIKPVTSAPMLA